MHGNFDDLIETTIDATSSDRPAVIVQVDALPEEHASVVLCPITSEIVDAAAFWVTIEPMPLGWRLRSQVMAGKPTPHERIGRRSVASAPAR